MDLHIKYRPTTLDQVVGQGNAILVLKGYLATDSVPHVICFTGNAGVGKTTLARIMANELGATGMALTEKNLGVHNGIEDIRDLGHQASHRALGGNNSVFILDEFHSITKQASQGLLKLFEDCPKHAYFFCCTSQPEKIDKAIRTRMTVIELGTVKPSDLEELLLKVMQAEDKVNEPVAKQLANAAGGSAREALVKLGQAIASGYAGSVIEELTTPDVEKSDRIWLAREMMNQEMPWTRVFGQLKDVTDDEVESLRWLLLRYAQSCLGSGGTKADQAARVITAMKSPFFDAKKAGFLANCYLAHKKK